MPYIVQSFNGTPIRHLVIGDALGDSLTVGRQADNHLQIDDNTLSAHHARVECREDGYWIIDLDSTNGVLHRGKRVPSLKLREGDVVTVGTHDLVFTEQAPELLASTAKIRKSWIPGLYYTHAD